MYATTFYDSENWKSRIRIKKICHSSDHSEHDEVFGHFKTKPTVKYDPPSCCLNKPFLINPHWQEMNCTPCSWIIFVLVDIDIRIVRFIQTTLIDRLKCQQNTINRHTSFSEMLQYNGMFKNLMTMQWHVHFMFPFRKLLYFLSFSNLKFNYGVTLNCKLCIESKEVTRGHFLWDILLLKTL